ncbi:MAG: carbohydrate kinase [Actinobacteria bacterium]|nr:carbohydrate kinase [Actinomycetota bacterium]
MTAIASIGHLTRDVVANGASRPGGTVFYSARALAQLDADARIVASCSALDRDELVPRLEAFGLPVTWRASHTTARYSFHYEGDRRIMRQDAVGEPWGAAEAAAAASEAEWILVGALNRSDFSPDVLATLARGGAKLLVDGQGLVRLPELGPLRTDGNIGSALEHVSILKLDSEEAETLVGSADPSALQSLGVPEVILTLGSQGSVVITADEIAPIPARVVVGTVDPTGAGDTFSAAYLNARAAGAAPVAAADRATVAVAAFLTTG